MSDKRGKPRRLLINVDKPGELRIWAQCGPLSHVHFDEILAISGTRRMTAVDPKQTPLPEFNWGDLC